MAEKPVIVPVEIDAELSMKNVDPKKLEKGVLNSLSGIKKVLTNAFSVDGSILNKSIINSLSRLDTVTNQAFTALKNYRHAIEVAGKSSDEYKRKLKELVVAKQELEQITLHMRGYEDENGNFIGNTKADWETY